jgi:osmoprotectant transport system substrate-binding protein
MTGRSRARALAALACLTAAVAAISGCSDSPTPLAGASSTTSTSTSTSSTTTATHATTTTSSSTTSLPGTGKPAVTIGDKNYTEQFLLGELYTQALNAQGFDAVLNRNIGPTEVTIPALESGRLDMYPEYLDAWNRQVAGDTHRYGSLRAAYQAGQRFALTRGLQLLGPTPFSDTDALAVTRTFATENGLGSLGDLSTLPNSVTVGGPPQFEQDPNGLPAIERTYGFTPAGFKPLVVGGQYPALTQGAVQAADVNTTDAELTTNGYTVLADPSHAFGPGNVVPVASVKTMLAEGPAFAATIDRVSALLTLPVMRDLNADVDISHENPADVARAFLRAHGLVPTPGH